MLARRLLDAWLWFVIAVIALLLLTATLGLVAGFSAIILDALR